ncbi:MAG: MerR family transcriptional regulator [Desulfobacterales bacterium]
MGFTKKQVAEISGLNPRLVQFYTEEGLISPIEDTGMGRGSSRKYSRKNLFFFLLIKELSYYGITKTKMETIVNRVQGFPLLGPYFEEKRYEKGHDSFLFILIEKNGIDTLVSEQLKVGSKGCGKIKDHISYMCVNLGKLAEKAHKAEV